MGYVNVVFFFFQAEDGIRDLVVTGVQSVLFRSYTKTKLSPFKTLVADFINIIQSPDFAVLSSISEISIGLHRRIFFTFLLLGITI